MNNHMAGVAKLQGLELREEFRIEKCQGLFRFTEDGLQRMIDSSTTWMLAEHFILGELLNGKETVIKFPWKPEVGEQYYVPYVDSKGLITGALQAIKLPWKPSHYNEVYYLPSIISIGKYIKLFWAGSESDKSSYQQGLICRTKEEAIELAEEMLDIARKRFAGDR